MSNNLKDMLENKFKENSDDLKNCMKLLDLNSIDPAEKINKSKILLNQIKLLKQLINKLKNHQSNRENISINFW